MKLTILGTGNAAVTECYNTCFALSENGQHFIVDGGGGNRILGILKEKNIALEDIHDLFVTHEHVDHLFGAIWLIRVIGQKMNAGKYDGELRVYCHAALADTIRTIAELTIQKKTTRLIGGKIRMIPLGSGDTHTILGSKVTFFDIGSTKAKQFGFTMETPQGVKLTCCGDEPYNDCEEEYVRGSDWMMHEAFCLYEEADRFKPYEKHHSTVREACLCAQRLNIPNLILYHTEDSNIKTRKERYTAEGRSFYTGNLYVPDDGETFEI